MKQRLYCLNCNLSGGFSYPLCAAKLLFASFWLPKGSGAWGRAPHSARKRRYSARSAATWRKAPLTRSKALKGSQGENKSFPPVRGCPRQPRTTSQHNFNAPLNYNLSSALKPVSPPDDPAHAGLSRRLSRRTFCGTSSCGYQGTPPLSPRVG